MTELRIPVAAEQAGLRLDVFLARRLRRSRVAVRRLLEKGAARSDGQRLLKAGSRLHGNQVVVLTLPEHPPEPEEEVDYHVLYEDEDLVAVDKPAGFPVHPTGRYVERSLLRALRRRGGGFDPGAPVHRLDRDTTGVVLFARSPMARRTLGRALATGGARKLYLAWVEGVPHPRTGCIDLPLGPAGDAIAVRQAVRPRSEGGRLARTRFRVLARRGPISLVAATPLTGRTHQIRVHLAAAGAPLCGDRLYGAHKELYLALRHRAPDAMEARALRMPFVRRHALHAAVLELTHPRTGQRLRLASPIPPDVAALWRAARTGELDELETSTGSNRCDAA